MGILAMAGALQGLGKGIQGEVANSREIDKEKRQEEKEIRLRQMEMDYQKSAEAQRQTFQSGQQDKLFGQQKQLAEATQTRQEAVEGQKTTSAEKIASEGNASRERIAGVRAKASMAGKKFQSRWQFVAVPGAAQIVNGEITNKPASLILADKASGKAWSQKGDKFLPQGVDEKTVKTPGKGAVDFLMQNPDAADEFVAKYNYLPSKFIGQMQSQMTTSQTSKSTDEGDDEE